MEKWSLLVNKQESERSDLGCCSRYYYRISMEKPRKGTKSMAEQSADPGPSGASKQLARSFAISCPVLVDALVRQLSDTDT
jgi:hypothetical protein